MFGDFDADGVTGTALLAEGLEQLGARVIPYLPHRVTEGHGLSSQAVHVLREEGASLIVTVDCGVASFNEVAEATALGMDTIITDHHSPPPRLPDALAIVNPKLSGSEYPNPGLAGVGLALKLVQGLCDSLGAQWSDRLLQLAALGTVTDVTPLVGENRYIVAAGLRSLNADPWPGLRELLRAGGQEGTTVDTESISFVLGPRLNAPGRLGHAITAYNLLRAPSPEQAVPLAQELELLNRRAAGTDGQSDRARKGAGGGRPSRRAATDVLERGVRRRNRGPAGQQAFRGAVSASGGGGCGGRPGAWQRPEHP